MECFKFLAHGVIHLYGINMYKSHITCFIMLHPFLWYQLGMISSPEVLRLVRLAKLARGLRVVRMARIMDSLHLLHLGPVMPWDALGATAPQLQKLKYNEHSWNMFHLSNCKILSDWIERVASNLQDVNLLVSTATIQYFWTPKHGIHTIFKDIYLPTTSLFIVQIPCVEWLWPMWAPKFDIFGYTNGYKNGNFWANSCRGKRFNWDFLGWKASERVSPCSCGPCCSWPSSNAPQAWYSLFMSWVRATPCGGEKVVKMWILDGRCGWFANISVIFPLDKPLKSDGFLNLFWTANLVGKHHQVAKLPRHVCWLLGDGFLRTQPGHLWRCPAANLQVEQGWDLLWSCVLLNQQQQQQQRRPQQQHQQQHHFFAFFGFGMCLEMGNNRFKSYQHSWLTQMMVAAQWQQVAHVITKCQSDVKWLKEQDLCDFIIFLLHHATFLDTVAGTMAPSPTPFSPCLQLGPTMVATKLDCWAIIQLPPLSPGSRMESPQNSTFFGWTNFEAAHDFPKAGN